MKLFVKYIHLLLIALFFSCSVDEEYSVDGVRNFDALWRILDERYSYFDLKLPEGVSWQDIYNKYRPKVSSQMTSDELYAVMNAMMGELKDGHNNIYTPFDYGRYWAWRDDYPANYDERLISRYLGRNYRIAGSLRYTQVEYNGHKEDKIAYLRYASFASPLSSSNLNAVLSRLSHCQALIIDIRDNGGGNITTSDLFARHFIQESRVVGRIRHKVGVGHNDFSSFVDIKIEPLPGGLRWLRPVVVLTNRGVYSAANDFVLKMKGLPLVTIIGDVTGGGGGLPMSSELPNGWGVRYSSTQTVNLADEHIEFGIAPDYNISLNPEDAQNGVDSIIEAAIYYLKLRIDEYKRTKIWRK